MNYCNVNENEERLKILIAWLINDVQSAGGDGDGIWYSKYYSVKDIKVFIEKHKLLPEHWVLNDHGETAFSIGENQEWLYITNLKSDFDTRPEWQQVSVVY